jgi:transcriptional regulator GlxA family with amidase domain
MRIVFPLYKQVTQLDFTAPLEVFCRLPGAECVLASVAGGSLQATPTLQLSGLTPLSSIDRCDLLCVPGGYGAVSALDDEQYLGELARLADSARWVTSVCTGSLLLGAAGLLTGKRAACHWAWRDLLVHFGAVPDPARIVQDGNVITGGGVTAGLDMALSIAATVAGPHVAQALQLAVEYAPAPPFDCGRPELASAEVRAHVQKALDTLAPERQQAVLAAAARLRARGAAEPS